MVSHDPDKLAKKLGFRSAPFYFKRDGLFATKKSMYHYNELSPRPFNLCRCYSCGGKQPQQ